jgi:DNA-binding IclR family transcriptional regulator
MERMAQNSGPASGRNTTADRAIDVLLLFDDDAPVLSAGEVAERLDMSRSTTYRYLQSLRSYDLLEEDEIRGGFRLGPRVHELARVARKGLGLSEIALPIMQALCNRVGEAVLLTRRFGDRVVCVERVEGSSPTRLSYERGHVLPVHAGASAKVLLAFAQPEDIDKVLATATLERFTESTVTDADELRRQLAKIRELGYSVSDGEIDLGVRGVAAPILSPDGHVRAGLSAAGLAFRLTDSVLPDVIAAVKDSAEAISNRFAEISG